MSTLHGRSKIGPDGTLRIPLPTACANSEIEYVLEFHAPGTNGVPPATTLRTRSGAERRDSLRRLAGSVDDATFSRPAQGEMDRVEPMD